VSFIELRKGFRCDEISMSFALIDNRGLEPPLINPEKNFCLTDMKYCRQAFHREQIAADLS